MQTLWARAAQTRCTCKYSSYLSNTTTLARRTITAASKNRLRPKNISTVFYSTVFAVAAVVDSKRKDARRKEWDIVIGEAREDLKFLEDEQQRRLEALSGNPDDLRKLAREGMCTWEDVFEWSNKEIRARNALGFQDWKGIPLGVLKTLSTSEIEDTLNNDGIFHRRIDDHKGSGSQEYVLPTKKLKTLEWSIAKLAYRLLQQKSRNQTARDNQTAMCEELPHTSTAGWLDLSQESNEAHRRLIELRQRYSFSDEFDGFSSPNLPKYSKNRSISPQKVAVLNSSLKDTFFNCSCNGDTADALIAKICYQLLISDVPPDIYTYTLLITKFTFLEHYDLVKSVLVSMKECHIRPNEESLIACLDYYTAAKDVHGFKKLVGQMKGFNGGLSVAPPDAKITRATVGLYRFYSGLKKDSPRYVPSNKDPRRIKRSLNMEHCVHSVKIIRKAPMNQAIYGALIHGALKLFGSKQAMINYISMISEGIEPSLEILTSILQSCCHAKDWVSGRLVWTYIQNLARGADHLAYHWMLRLCQKCREKGTFWKVVQEGVRRGVILPTANEFRKLIANLEADALISYARERFELYQGPMCGSSLTETREWIEKMLVVRAEKMASTARLFGYWELGQRCSPTIGHWISIKIEALHISDYSTPVKPLPSRIVPSLHAWLQWIAHEIAKTAELVGNMDFSFRVASSVRHTLPLRTQADSEGDFTASRTTANTPPLLTKVSKEELELGVECQEQKRKEDGTSLESNALEAQRIESQPPLVVLKNVSLMQSLVPDNDRAPPMPSKPRPEAATRTFITPVFHWNANDRPENGNAQQSFSGAYPGR